MEMASGGFRSWQELSQMRRAGGITLTPNALSRLLCFVLRHGPDTMGVVVDNEGWALSEELFWRIQEAQVMLL